jgi:uncharacterized protein (DUF427 family)
MSLTTARGPLSDHPAGRFVGRVYLEPFPRRVRGRKDGEWVVESDAVLLVHRPTRPPSYAFPAGDVRVEATPVAEADGYVDVAWDAVDEWWEEDERMLGHPRNPYHRVDCVRTSRRLRVEVAGEVLVDTDAAVGVFETAIEPRLYVPRDLVRMELLRRSTTTTYCPYKGTATYWHAAVGDTVVEDVAWTYEDPFPECHPIDGMVSFYAERTDLTVTPPFPRSPA